MGNISFPGLFRQDDNNDKTYKGGNLETATIKSSPQTERGKYLAAREELHKLGLDIDNPNDVKIAIANSKKLSSLTNGVLGQMSTSRKMNDAGTNIIKHAYNIPDIPRKAAATLIQGYGPSDILDPDKQLPLAGYEFQENNPVASFLLDIAGPSIVGSAAKTLANKGTRLAVNSGMVKGSKVDLPSYAIPKDAGTIMGSSGGTYTGGSIKGRHANAMGRRSVGRNNPVAHNNGPNNIFVGSGKDKIHITGNEYYSNPELLLKPESIFIPGLYRPERDLEPFIIPKPELPEERIIFSKGDEGSYSYEELLKQNPEAVEGDTIVGPDGRKFLVSKAKREEDIVRGPRVKYGDPDKQYIHIDDLDKYEILNSIYSWPNNIKPKNVSLKRRIRENMRFSPTTKFNDDFTIINDR